MGGIAAMLQFPFSPFLLWLEKNLTIIVHLSKEYSSHSAVSALSLTQILTEVPGEVSS